MTTQNSRESSLADFSINVAHAHYDLGRYDAAEKVSNALLMVNPQDAEALHLLGLTALARRDFTDAVRHFREALLWCDSACIHKDLGIALSGLGRFDEAESSCACALKLCPCYAEALLALGAILRGANKFEKAETALRGAIDLSPANADIYVELASVLRETDRITEAMSALDEAVALHPDYAYARLARAHIALLQGHFDQGWADYEWRCRTKEADAEERYISERQNASGLRMPALPVWSGGPLYGRTILVRGEQGHGDVIQFARYIPMIAACAGRVMLEVYPTLVRLLENLPGVKQVVPYGAMPRDAELQCAMLSLPRVFRTTLDSIPATVPYLVPPSDVAARWAKRLPKTLQRRVGIVWAGNPRHKNDKRRSICFEALAPLWQVDDVHWVSLQVGPRAFETRTAPRLIEDMAIDLTDFAETAGALAQLDLLIAADTAVAHLAGAIGLPVWILLPFAADWRWLRDGDSTPWYPTMRLFRQDNCRSWNSVIASVVEALRNETR